MSHASRRVDLDDLSHQIKRSVNAVLESLPEQENFLRIRVTGVTRPVRVPRDEDVESCGAVDLNHPVFRQR
jgi:hypothetical protein